MLKSVRCWPPRANVPGDQEQKLTGVRLRDVPDRVKVKTAGHKVVFSWQEIYNSPLGEGMLVYFAKDGVPLGAEEGRIALASLKDTNTGPRHVKWLRKLDIKKVAE
jgi:hypothetical protein